MVKLEAFSFRFECEVEVQDKLWRMEDHVALLRWSLDQILAPNPYPVRQITN